MPLLFFSINFSKQHAGDVADLHAGGSAARPRTCPTILRPLPPQFCLGNPGNRHVFDRFLALILYHNKVTFLTRIVNT